MPSLNVQSSAVRVPVIALVLAAITQQWVGIVRIAPWFIAVIAVVLLATVTGRRVLARSYAPDQAGRMTLQMLAGVVPLTVIWPTLVLFAWVSGDPTNNAFLVSFLFVSMVANVPLGGPCLQLGLPAMAIYVPLLGTHVIGHGAWMYAGAAALQIVAAFYICDLWFRHHRIFKLSVLQRFEKEDLAEKLAAAGEELARALVTATQANNAKSAFLAGMSHELRTPLNAIIGFSDMIRQQVYGPLSPPRYRDYVDHIHGSGEHLLGLINDILDLAKIEAGKHEFVFEELDVAGIARNALSFVEPQALKKNIIPRVEINEESHPSADKRAMLQVLTNLLSNAVKFTPAEGVVTLFARRLPSGALAIGVEDTGIGMSASELKKAVELYGQAGDGMTVEGHGTGLGLPICKALVEAQGATFHIESESGKGTRSWAEFSGDQVIVRSAEFIAA